MNQEFNMRLKKAMNIRAITQSELCEKTGIPKSAMSQYISGNFKPKQNRTNGSFLYILSIHILTIIIVINWRFNVLIGISYYITASHL